MSVALACLWPINKGGVLLPQTCLKKTKGNGTLLLEKEKAAANLRVVLGAPRCHTPPIYCCGAGWGPRTRASPQGLRAAGEGLGAQGHAWPEGAPDQDPRRVPGRVRSWPHCVGGGGLAPRVPVLQPPPHVGPSRRAKASRPPGGLGVMALIDYFLGGSPLTLPSRCGCVSPTPTPPSPLQLSLQTTSEPATSERGERVPRGVFSRPPVHVLDTAAGGSASCRKAPGCAQPFRGDRLTPPAPCGPAARVTMHAPQCPFVTHLSGFLACIAALTVHAIRSECPMSPSRTRVTCPSPRYRGEWGRHLPAPPAIPPPQARGSVRVRRDRLANGEASRLPAQGAPVPAGSAPTECHPVPPRFT